jgi:hypothetical protein
MYEKKFWDSVDTLSGGSTPYAMRIEPMPWNPAGYPGTETRKRMIG